MSDIWHVYPENDLKPHQTEGRDCWCRPRIEKCDGGDLVVHNSLDRREVYEELMVQ